MKVLTGIGDGRYFPAAKILNPHKLNSLALSQENNGQPITGQGFI
jgi:hypothetical protein